MSQGTELQAHAVKEASLADSISASFARELQTVQTLVARQIRSLMRTLETTKGHLVATKANLGRSLQLRQDVQAALDAAGYGEIAFRAVDAPLDRLAVSVLSGRSIAAKAATLTPFDVDAIVAFKELHFADLLDVGSSAGRQIERLALDGVLGVRPVDDLVADLEDALDATTAEARTVYDTAVSTFSRQVDQLHATGQADELFFYVGPVDSLTREFCLERVGRVFTRSEIEDMDNGQLPNVLTTGGGYNCRHAWKHVSVLDDELLGLAESGDALPSIAAAVEAVA
jgi:hypothetical protein